LTFTHYLAAMAAPPEQRHCWLDCAEKNNWSVSQLRAEIAATKTISTKPDTTKLEDKAEDKSEDKIDNKPDNNNNNNKSDDNKPGDVEENAPVCSGITTA
jgi:hypothetical protein